LIQMNKFEIIDMQGMNTLGFVVEKNEEELKKGNAFLSLQKIEYTNSEQDGKFKKTFNVICGGEDKQLIVLLTLTKSKVILSTGELTKDGFKATESNIPLSYGTIFNTETIEYKEIEYNPDMKRHFCIIDTVTGEEVKPVVFIDNNTNTIKGTCKILPHRPYIVLELMYEL
ncbi:MAG: hypothetical protein RSC92_03295, partial [Clostridia bacterium]